MTVRGHCDLRSVSVAFSDFAKGVRQRVLRKVVNAGTKPLFDAIKPLIPTETRLMRKAFGRVVKTYRESGVVFGVIGVRTRPSFRQEVRIKRNRVFRLSKRGRAFRVLKPTPAQLTMTRWPRKYLHLVLKGTKRTRANNFMLAGYNAGIGAARAAMRQKMAEELRIESQKAAAKQASKRSRPRSMAA